MSLTATSAPSSAKISAMPRPMPRLAPVISAFFPFNLVIDSGPERVAEFLEVRLADFGRLARGVRHLLRAIELVHDVGVRVRFFHRREDRFQIDDPFAERAVAGHLVPS